MKIKQSNKIQWEKKAGSHILTVIHLTVSIDRHNERITTGQTAYQCCTSTKTTNSKYFDNTL